MTMAGKVDQRAADQVELLQSDGLKPSGGGMIWLLVRVKRKHAGRIKLVEIGGEFEAYKDRAGRARKRKIKGTGSPAFTPVLLLQRAGFEVFMPVEYKDHRKSRYSRERHLVPQPLLMDWLFVGFPDGQNRLADLAALDVVTGIAGEGRRPAIVKHELVLDVMRQWGGGMLSPSCHQMVKNGHDFQPGDSAKVAFGSLAGVHVEVAEVNGKKVRAVLELLGEKVSREFNGLDLDRVKDDE
ncbi:transcription termination/antitermination protein NusG [Leisingera sp. M658]|uniref:transcription termination/antitermination protein NusG n=1 Tax=Leisingera sp. M658 TaxID=2867015 RepID=UPI0021A5FD7E|nr:hypothetical protein [Leisingera sp. M658]UWQ77368.1 hypothetical protein K3724_22800 [Leisingera sp. M658]